MSDWKQLADADVLTLGMAADDLRRGSMGTTVTYLRVHVVTPSTIGAAVPEPAAELRLYATPSTLDEALAQVRALKAAAGGRRVAAFSMAAIEASGWTEDGGLNRLVEAGLQDVAELPVDQLADLPGSVDALLRAGAEARRITTAAPIGDRKLEMLGRVKAAVERHPSVRRYSPLPRTAPVDTPTTGYDDVRMVALARLALGSLSIEVDWSLYGPKLAQVALTFGADHLDAVPPSDDASLGPRRATVEDVERNIRAAGFHPQERGALA